MTHHGFSSDPIDPVEYAHNVASMFRRWVSGKWTTPVSVDPDGKPVAYFVYANPHTGQTVQVVVETIEATEDLLEFAIDVENKSTG